MYKTYYFRGHSTKGLDYIDELEETLISRRHRFIERKACIPKNTYRMLLTEDERKRWNARFGFDKLPVNRHYEGGRRKYIYYTGKWEIKRTKVGSFKAWWIKRTGINIGE